MKEYRNHKLHITSDFEIRNLREEGGDVDLIIGIERSVLNINIDDMPKYISNRLQLTEVRNILIRFNTDEKNNICTIHFLKSIDIHSAILNFTMDYSEHSIDVFKSDYSVDMHINKNIENRD